MSVFGSLFDFRFDRLVAPTILRILYAIDTVIICLVTVFGSLFFAVNQNAIALVIGPIVGFILLLSQRIIFESIVIKFQVAQDVRDLRNKYLSLIPPVATATPITPPWSTDTGSTTSASTPGSAPLMNSASAALEKEVLLANIDRELIVNGYKIRPAENLAGADLTGANLNKAKLAGANLNKAKLAGANLNKANLNKANLTGADLSGANLQGADLTGADLTGADLTDAYLGWANLSLANLTDAILKGTRLRSVNFNGALMPDGTKHA